LDKNSKSVRLSCFARKCCRPSPEILPGSITRENYQKSGRQVEDY
jgi:hypothetical protein